MKITQSDIDRGANEFSYEAIHAWLKYHFPKKPHCENKNCERTSSTFDFALRKGFKYAKNRDNFVVLCRKCHKFYDREIINPKRLKVIINMRKSGCIWKEIAFELGMDFRNAARDYKLSQRKVVLDELREAGKI